MLTQKQIDLRTTQHAKPHIYLHAGYWHVSPMPKPFFRHKADFIMAYCYINRLNYLRKNRNG